MKGTSRRVSKVQSIFCPRCEIGEVRIYGSAESSCAFCGRAVNGTMLESLRQIVSLPEIIGGHACECGHLDMRHLPDGVFHCPACGAEVLPLNPSWSS